MVALYIFLLSWKANWLSFLTIPMLLAGFIKYIERILVIRSANCGLNTLTTPFESIEAQALWYFKMFRYLFLNKKISNLTDDQVLTTFDSQTTWKVIEVELEYAYDVYYTKAPKFVFHILGFHLPLLLFYFHPFCACAFPFKWKAQSPINRFDYHLLTIGWSYSYRDICCHFSECLRLA